MLLYPLTFVSVLQRERKILRLSGAITLAMILPILAATESMGGWFCFLIVSILMLFFFLVPKNSYLWVCLATFIILMFLVYAGVKTKVVPKISSLTDRINYWSAAVNIIKSHPVAGTGPGNFSQFYLRYKVPGAMEAKFAHNVIVELLVSAGLIGFIFFALSIFFFIKKNIKNFLAGNHLLTGFMFGLLGFFLHCLVDFDYADAAICVIAFAFAGLIESALNPEKKRPQGLTKLIAGIIIIMALFSAIIEIKAWQVEKSIESVIAGAGKTREDPIQVLEKAATIFPEPDVFFIQAEIFKHIYLKTKEYEIAEKAIVAYKKAIEINKFSPKYHRALAMMLMKIGRNQEAEKEFLKVLELYPTKALYNFELGIFYKKIGKNELAKIYLERGKTLPASSKDEAIYIMGYNNGKDL
ncbi:MAG: O-antigen ligase family protein [Candidatus Omnitrophica bacterium]|nr:O-antigen ligase family protein [Candidatus Omnitrophota bacterium]